MQNVFPANSSVTDESVYMCLFAGQRKDRPVVGIRTLCGKYEDITQCDDDEMMLNVLRCQLTY